MACRPVSVIRWSGKAQNRALDTPTGAPLCEPQHLCVPRHVESSTRVPALRSCCESQTRGPERGSVSRSTSEFSRRSRLIRTLSRQPSRCGSQTRAPLSADSCLVVVSRSSQNPKFQLQMNSKPPNPKLRFSRARQGLELGIWSFFGNWILGIWSFHSYRSASPPSMFGVRCWMFDVRFIHNAAPPSDRSSPRGWRAANWRGSRQQRAFPQSQGTPPDSTPKRRTKSFVPILRRTAPASVRP